MVRHSHGTDWRMAAEKQARAVQYGKRGTGGGAAAGGTWLKISSATAPTTASVNGSRAGQDQRVFISFLTTWPPRQANASTLDWNTFTTDVVQIPGRVYTIPVFRRDGFIKYFNTLVSKLKNMHITRVTFYTETFLWMLISICFAFVPLNFIQLLYLLLYHRFHSLLLLPCRSKYYKTCVWKIALFGLVARAVDIVELGHFVALVQI